MKRNCILFLLLYIMASWMFSSCSRQADENAKVVLTQAEKVMYTAPDSALHLLEGLRPPKEGEQRATWALLLAQARYKTNKKQSDSLVNAAYRYFEKTDDVERKALALYLKGSIAGENGDVKAAQHDYLIAQTEVEKTKDYRLGFLITSNLCNLYVKRGLKELALQSLESASVYAELLGNSDYLISANIWAGRVNIMKPTNYEKAVAHYKKAMEMALKFHNRRKLEMVTWELVGTYSLMNNYNQALRLVRQGIRLYDDEHPCPERTLVLLGNIYSKLGRVDSAYFCLNEAITIADNPRIKRSAYNYLYNLEYKCGHYKEALEACEQCLIYTDSINRAEKAQELIEMQVKYDQQKVVIERNRLQMEKDKIIRNSLLILIFAILIIALLIGVYQRILIRKERALKKQEKLVRENAQKIAENELVILRNEQRMSELTQQIEAEGDLKEQLQEQTATLNAMKKQNDSLVFENEQLQSEQNNYLKAIEEQSAGLQKLNELTAQNKHLHERENALTGYLVKKSVLLDKVKAKHPYVQDEEWELLKEELNLIFDGYTHRLLKLVPSISESELRLACLIKLRMSNKDMSEVLAISPSSVGKAKLRLKDRLFHEIASFDKRMLLDVWLWDF